MPVLCILLTSPVPRYTYVSSVKKATIVAAVIIGACTLLAALMQKYVWNPKHQFENVSITGIVIDDKSRLGIGQASIVVVGHPEQYRTEDNGNFHFTIWADKSAVVRLLVSKRGYRSLDETVRLPAETLTLPLLKQ
jgi:hypothetical protein